MYIYMQYLVVNMQCISNSYRYVICTVFLFRKDKNNALINAMADILWRAKSHDSVVLVLYVTISHLVFIHCS